MSDFTTHEARARERVVELGCDYPLPDGCSTGEVFLERTRVDRLDLFLVGLTAQWQSGEQAIGSAAGREGFEVDRAFFELLERVSLLLARRQTRAFALRDAAGAPAGEARAAEVFPTDAQPERVRASLSNGVALHRTWEQACEAALCELVERDRVLRSFSGDVAPRRLEVPQLDGLKRSYVVEAYALDPELAGLKHFARGVFLFPQRPHAPFIHGFGAAQQADDAMAHALREALQTLGFLWGEEIPQVAPKPSPRPEFHQEYYLVPAHRRILRDWLDGRFAQQEAVSHFDGDDVRYADLTPAALSDRAAVVRALASTARPLRFGAPQSERVQYPHPIA